MVNETVTATTVTVGDTLASSTLSGTFKVSASDATVVPGTLVWTNSTTVVNATGNFEWTFTPTDLEAYNVVTGTVEVVANPVLTAEEIAATNAVGIAEGSKTMVNIVAAKDLVDALGNGAKKTELQGRLDNIDNIIVMDEHQLDLALKTSAKTVVLGASFTTTEGYYGIAKEGVTIDGVNQYTITGSLRVVADDVTLKNLTVDLAMSTPGTWVSGSFAVQVYRVAGVKLDNVTLKNANVGLYVNSATVTVNNITTTSNGFGGIGVGNNITGVPSLTVTGTNTHNDAVNMPHIYEENAVRTWVTATGYTVFVAEEVYDTTNVKVGQTWYKK